MNENVALAKDVLDDLFLLSGEKEHALYIRLNKILDKMSSQNKLLNTINSFPKISRMTQAYIKSLFESFCDGEKINCSLKELSMDEVDQFTHVIELISLMTKSFRPIQVNSVEINQKVRIKLELNRIVNEEALRKISYRVTKSLLKVNWLLTFKILPGQDQAICIELNAQKIEKLNGIRAYELSSDLWIGFDEAFSDFIETRCESNKFLGPTYLFDESGHVRKVDEYFCENNEYDIFHFNFLFRPISFIINSEGKNIPKTELIDLVSTGCDTDILQHEVNGNKSKNIFYFDFCKLLSL